MKKLLMTLMCVLLVCGCSSKKDDDVQNVPSPTPTPDEIETNTVKLSELIPENIHEVTISVETSTEIIDIEFKDEEVKEIVNHLKEMEVSEDFQEHTGSGALAYYLRIVDDQGNEHEIVEQGNVLRLADGTKTGPLSDKGMIHEYVMAMDWVIQISSYETLTPLMIETDEYIIVCEKGMTSTYDLAYLKDVGFDPFELGFTVTVDGTDTLLEEMPAEGDYLLILTKGNTNASYQLKVTSSVK